MKTAEKGGGSHGCADSSQISAVQQHWALTEACQVTDEAAHPEWHTRSPTVTAPKKRRGIEAPTYLLTGECFWSGRVLQRSWQQLVRMVRLASRWIQRSRTERTGTTMSFPTDSGFVVSWCCRRADAHRMTSIFAVFSWRRKISRI